MLDIQALKSDVLRRKTVIVDVIEATDPPTVTFEFTDAIRERERKANAKYNRVVFTMGKESQGTVLSDKLAYCQEMVDLCVVDSARLFADKGQPVAHSNAALKSALNRYPKLLDWFADALTAALNDDSELQKVFESDRQKN